MGSHYYLHRFPEEEGMGRKHRLGITVNTKILDSNK
jgi:hypothetical protein